jgi:hypothetical protein
VLEEHWKNLVSEISRFLDDHGGSVFVPGDIFIELVFFEDGEDFLQELWHGALLNVSGSCDSVAVEVIRDSAHY